MVAMSEVELVEDDEPAPRGRRDRPRDAPVALLALRWHRWFAVPVAVVVLALTAQHGVAAYEHRTDGRYTGTPGVLARLHPPLRTLWTSTRMLAWGAGVVDGRAVVTELTAGAVRAAAVDVTTGTNVWSTELPGASGQSGSCLPDASSGGAAATRIVCVTSDRLATTSDGPTVPGPGRLTVLDARSGSLLSSTATRGADSFDVRAGRAVLAAGSADGGVDVRAVDVTTGATLWATATPAAASTQLVGTGAAVLVAADEVVVLDGSGLAHRLALADGAVVAAPQPVIAIRVAPDGRRAVLTVGAPGSDAASTLVVAGVGHDLVLPGADRTPFPDDGSLPGLVLVQDEQDATLSAYDATTGARRWSASVTLEAATVVLDHVVYGLVEGAGSDGAVVALDGRTGRVLWRAAADTSSGQLLTDGFDLLVVEGVGEDGTAHARVVALDRRSGHVAWRSPLPAGTGAYLLPVGDALVSVGDRVSRIG